MLMRPWLIVLFPLKSPLPIFFFFFFFLMCASVFF